MSAAELFAATYGHDPAGVFSAPGRVNLIGEHTDYTGGLVLPFAIDARAFVAAAPNADGVLRAVSAQIPGPAIEVPLDQLRPGSPATASWIGYPAGAIWALRTKGIDVDGIDLALDSQVPRGAGLSSSAAVECATTLAAAAFAGSVLDPLDVAAIAQYAENAYVGVPCGPMDQTASAAARAGSVLLFDTRAGTVDHIPFDPGAGGLAVAVVDTRVAHSLADGEYGRRRRSCERAAEILGVRWLRDLDVTDLDDIVQRLPDEELRARVRHVVTENDRVARTVDLLRSNRLDEIGDLLVASHRSLRDDYEVSCAELDQAVQSALDAGAIGARMTGGGFGGSVIALLPGDRVDALTATVTADFAARGFPVPVVRVVNPADGARREDAPAADEDREGSAHGPHQRRAASTNAAGGSHLSMAEGLRQAHASMQAAGVSPAAIDAFTHSYRELAAGETGLLSEADLDPVNDLPRHADMAFDPARARAALSSTVVIKLNGGLGTSMGMNRAKSLLDVRPGHSFLDIIAEQVLALRADLSVPLPVIFMNSFRTSHDTRETLAAYGDLAVPGLPLEFLQNRVPKLLASDLTPVRWPADPELEWCPPGHGDIYTALYGTGLLGTLLERGFRYMFVSNADNLGARPDPSLAAWFVASGAPYAAELSRKTDADRKGGQLVRRRADGQLIQRETAQTRPEDMDAALDAARHPFFHTNNLWVDLRALDEVLTGNDGVLGLPIIRNVKTVDPRDPSSPQVIQIETAMGAAVGVFPGAVAVEVDRSRFLPVKTTSDLLVLRSDAYELTGDFQVRLAASRTAAPLVELASPYKFIQDFDRLFPYGAPSLVECDRLEVNGPWTFGRNVVVRGTVALPADGGSVSDGTVLGASTA